MTASGDGRPLPELALMELTELGQLAGQALGCWHDGDREGAFDAVTAVVGLTPWGRSSWQGRSHGGRAVGAGGAGCSGSVGGADGQDRHVVVAVAGVVVGEGVDEVVQGLGGVGGCEFGEGAEAVVDGVRTKAYSITWFK